MFGPIDFIRSPSSIATTPTAFTSLQQKVCNVFEQVKTSISRVAADIQKSFDFRPLLEPGKLLEGGFWTGFLGLSVLFSGMSLYNLYNELTVEHSASTKFAKVAKAVKTAFVDLLSLGSATAYTVHWAHEVKILSLGQYSPLVKGVSYGASIIINLIEGGWSLFHIHTEKEALLQESSPARKEKHKERLCLSFIKLIGNISMVAWAALGIASIVIGLGVGSLLASTLLGIGCISAAAAFFYQKHIEKALPHSTLARPV